MSNPFSGFGGFDLGLARQVRIRSYTVGRGGGAQLTNVVLEILMADAAEPEVVDVDYGDDGPALAAVQGLVAALNRRLRERPDGGE